MNEESEDHTGMFHRFTKPSFAPEAEIVNTGAFVFAVLWYVAGSRPPATTGTTPEISSFDNKFLPLFGVI